MRIRLFGHYLHGSIAALLLLEGAMLFGILWLAALARFGTHFDTALAELGPLWPRALLFSLVVLVCLMAFGLYSARQRARAVGIFVRVGAAVSAGVAVTSIFLYLVPDLWLGRGVLALAAVGATGGIVLSRVLLDRLVHEDIFKRRVLVLGSGSRAARIAGLRRRADRRGFFLVGFVPADQEVPEIPADRLLDSRRRLREIATELEVDEVVVAMEDRRRGMPILELLECRLAGIDVTELLTFLERETGRVRIDVLNPSWLIFGEGFRRDSLRLFTSRALDLVASLVLVLATLPVMLATAIAIKLEEGWRAPLFYRQERVGFGGRTFQLLKFRSMRTDAETAGQAVWAQRNDPRVTRVGALIRKLRIDELPQILNVLMGHMSFVGPRPERPQFVDELSKKIPYYVQRHCVKPGITGWAQLCYPYGSSDQDALEKLQYDLYYIKNNSFLFDLAILVQTAEVVFLGKGAR